jgi:microcompartment protein CcmK/EutM
MQLGRVVDSVVSAYHHPVVAGHKLLLVQLVQPDGRTPQPGRPPLVAVDTVGAGQGALVLTCEEGRAARQVLQHDRPPVRTLILGIVNE